MPTLSRSSTIGASAERVFAYVDDIRNLARHMSEHGSMPTMGIKLSLKVVTLPHSGIRRSVGRALAGRYPQWCLGSMFDGTMRDLNRGSP